MSYILYKKNNMKSSNNLVILRTNILVFHMLSKNLPSYTSSTLLIRCRKGRRAATVTWRYKKRIRFLIASGASIVFRPYYRLWLSSKRSGWSLVAEIDPRIAPDMTDNTIELLSVLSSGSLHKTQICAYPLGCLDFSASLILHTW